MILLTITHTNAHHMRKKNMVRSQQIHQTKRLKETKIALYYFNENKLNKEMKIMALHILIEADISTFLPIIIQNQKIIEI